VAHGPARQVRGIVSRRALKLASVAVLWSACLVATVQPAPGLENACCPAARDAPGNLTLAIPPRPLHALTGSQFAQAVSTLEGRPREQAILHEILEGNLPGFLRRLVPVELADRTDGGRRLNATIFVIPDYLAIGSDVDFLRIPMNLETALAIAARFSAVLPTRKMVDAIYSQSAYHFVPEPLIASPQMRSTAYYWTHNEMIETQARLRGIPSGPLVSGHKKDVVVTNLLARTPGRIAIYGWHRPNGAPIQPLSTVHGVCYADYSHGIRLISELALEDGAWRSVRDLLQDSRLATALSDEGAIRRMLVGGTPGPGEGPTHCGPEI
jgi:hypothetical protein